MPRLERLFRPFERGLELHPDEIPDFPIDAIPHASLERLFGFIPVDVHTQRNGLFHLQTGPRRTEVFQDRRSFPLAARTFFTANRYRSVWVHPSGCSHPTERALPFADRPPTNRCLPGSP